MQIVITPLLTISDESAQAAHGNPIALFTAPEISFTAAPNHLVKVDGRWTTPAAIVQNWLDEATHPNLQVQFAQTFINPLFKPPTT